METLKSINNIAPTIKKVVNESADKPKVKTVKKVFQVQLNSYVFNRVRKLRARANKIGEGTYVTFGDIVDLGVQAFEKSNESDQNTQLAELYSIKQERVERSNSK